MPEETLETITHDGDEIALVKSTTPTKSLAVFITTACTKDGLEGVKLRGIGAGAVNQITKALITAKGRLLTKGVSVAFDINYKDVPNREKTGTISAIEFSIDFIRK